MAHRLSKITTRTGDAGATGLGDGARVAKCDARIEALGEVDETNSLIGLLLCEALPADVRALLLDIQHDLFDLGGELCIPDAAYLKAEQVAALDAALTRYNALLSPLKEFILPGGAHTAALAHLARTVCRRAERRLTLLGAQAAVSDNARRYLNRLSDLLFVLARVLNQAAGLGDVLWQKGKNAVK